MFRESPQRVIVPLLVIFAIFLALALDSEYWLGVTTGHRIGDDFYFYYDAYLKATRGENPYLPYNIGNGFLYHPFALTLVGLFSFWGIDIAIPAWISLSAISWIVSIFICLRLVRPGSIEQFAQSDDANWGERYRLEILRGNKILLLFIVFAPFWETLHIGQINLFVILFIYLSLYLSAKNRDIASGLTLSLAIMLKISPLIFLIYFVALKKYRTLIAVVIGTIILSFIPVIQFYPRILNDLFITSLRISSSIHPSGYNQSVSSVLFILLSLIGQAHIVASLQMPFQIILVIVVAVLVGTGLFISKSSIMLKMWLFAAMNMLMVVFSPLVWYHHSIFLLLPLVLLLFHRSGAYWAAGMGLLLIIQAERLIEHMTGPVGVAVLFAHLALAVAAISIYLDGWRRDITTRRLANASLGASRLSRREHAGECRYD